MKNWVQEGKTVTVTAPYDVDAGDGVLVGTMFGVAAFDSDSSGEAEIVTKGVFSMAKVSAQAWTVGAAIYWDDSAKNCTTTSGGNTKIGVATEVAANPSSTGKVRLNGAF